MGGFRLAPRSGRLVDYRTEVLTEMHRPDGRSGNVVAGSGEKLEGPIGRGNRNVIDLCKIVIVGCEPKHGHGIRAGGSGLLGEFHGAQGFVESERGAAEKSYLLSGDD